MEDINLVLIITGFFVGYITKGFLNFHKTYNASSLLVETTAKQCLKLLGTSVYRISFLEQVYKQAMISLEGDEKGKIYSNELEYEFNSWKKETMELFLEYYPEKYKWHIENLNWNEAMNILTDIYNKEKFENGKPKEHID